MAQVYDVYVKITGGTFIPMGLPVDYVWNVNQVVADFLIANGYAILTTSDGTPITLGAPEPE